VKAASARVGQRSLPVSLKALPDGALLVLESPVRLGPGETLRIRLS